MKKLFSLTLILILLLTGCSEADQTTPNSDGKLKIVTTFYPMYYFTKKIAGDTATVDLLVPNGVEPHDWEPTAKDMANIQDADVFIYNSRYFETWTKKVLKSIDQSNLKIVEASEGIELLNGNGEEGHSSTSKDPHVWLSPVLAGQEAAAIAKALEEVDSKNQEVYKKNLDAFQKELAELDQLYRNEIGQSMRKEFVTQHAAFSYLAKEYGLTQIAIAGLSPDVEPTMAKLAELTELTKEKDIKVIYFEGLTSSKVAKTLANEIGAKTEVLNPLEGLTKEEQELGLDYIGVMKKNLDALKKSIDE